MSSRGVRHMPKSFLKEMGLREMGERVVVGDEFEDKGYTSE